MDNEKLIFDISQDIISELYVEEVEFFENIFQEITNGQQSSFANFKIDNPLSFGVDQLINLATPVAIFMITHLINRLSRL